MLRASLLVVPLAFWLGCGDGRSNSDAEPIAAQPSSSASHAAERGTKVVLRDSDYGRMLFDSHRQAIYLFDKERSATPQCYGDCASAWPLVSAASGS